jgi:hypothetical protein
MYKNELVSLFIKRKKEDGVDLCYVNRNNIATIDLDDDYIRITLVNNDVLFGEYDILMTIEPLGLRDEIDMLTHLKGFKRENPYFNMEEYENGECHFSLSPEQKKASRLENENEANFFGTDECNNCMPF